MGRIAAVGVGVMALAMTLLSGCNQQQGMPQAPVVAAPPPPAVAVIDVDSVARALGRDTVMRQQIEQAAQNLTREMEGLAAELREQLQQEQGKLGEAPSTEQREQFARLGLEAQTRLQQGQQQAQRQVQELQVTLARSFQDEVRPVAAAIARKHGIGTVIPTSFVLWHDGTRDITAEVTSEMQAAGKSQ